MPAKKLKTMENLKNTLRLYSLTLIPPTLTSVFILIINVILGVETKFEVGESFYKAWIDYYFTGELLNIMAWRWHIMGLIVSYLIVKFN